MRLSKQQISLFIAILFHLCGLIGILFTPYKEWFIQNTPLNLCLMVALLAWNQPGKNFSFILFFGIAFLTGLATEMIGVHTGMLFGSYRYGNGLGPKLNGVPWLIGLNWFVVVFCSGTIMTQLQRWFRYRFEKEGAETPHRVLAMSFIVDGALLAVVFDWIMEPAAVKLGFWRWDHGEIPYFNYLSWFFISCLLLAVYRSFSFTRLNHFAVHLLIIQALFFWILGMYL